MTAFGFRCLRLVAVAIVGLTSSAAGFRVVVPPSTALDLGRGVPAASASNVASAGRAPLTAALVVDDSASPSEDGVGFRALGAGGSDGPSQLQDVEMPSARDVSRASPGAVVAPLSCSASGVDLERIKTLLPHRFPFLLVDRVLCATPEKALGLKLVTANEDFFNGHFPQRAIMPGVLQVEALAQLSGVVAMQALPSKEGSRLFFFGGVDGVKWKKPVVPGDVLVMETELISLRENLGIAKFAGRGYVDGKLCVEVKEMTFAFEK